MKPVVVSFIKFIEQITARFDGLSVKPDSIFNLKKMEIKNPI